MSRFWENAFTYWHIDIPTDSGEIIGPFSPEGGGPTKNYSDLKVLAPYSVSRKLQYKYTSITINNYYPAEQNLLKLQKRFQNKKNKGKKTVQSHP